MNFCASAHRGPTAEEGGGGEEEGGGGGGRREGGRRGELLHLTECASAASHWEDERKGNGRRINRRKEEDK